MPELGDLLAPGQESGVVGTPPATAQESGDNVGRWKQIFNQLKQNPEQMMALFSQVQGFAEPRAPGTSGAQHAIRAAGRAQEFKGQLAQTKEADAAAGVTAGQTERELVSKEATGAANVSESKARANLYNTQSAEIGRDLNLSGFSPKTVKAATDMASASVEFGTTPTRADILKNLRLIDPKGFQKFEGRKKNEWIKLAMAGGNISRRAAEAEWNSRLAGRSTGSGEEAGAPTEPTAPTGSLSERSRQRRADKAAKAVTSEDAELDAEDDAERAALFTHRSKFPKTRAEAIRRLQEIDEFVGTAPKYEGKLKSTVDRIVDTFNL